MLHREPRNNYIIFPSWEKLSYRWSDLPRLLSDPIHSGYLEPGRDEEDYWRYGYPKIPQPFDLLDGPVGGGVIRWVGDADADRGWRWLPIMVLYYESNLCLQSMEVIHKSFNAHVLAMEPHGRGLGRSKLYACPTTVEHIDSAGQTIYWAICTTKGRRPLIGVDEIPT